MNGKVRVLYLVPCLMTGGLERMVFLLATGLDPERFAPEVEVFERFGGLAAATREKGIPVRFDRRNAGPLDVRYLVRLARRLAADPPDLLHAHNATALVYGAFAARAAEKLGAKKIPVLYTEHDRSFGGKLASRAVHFAAGRLVDRGVSVAEWLKAALIRFEGFPAERLSVVPNGIEGERFEAPVDRLAVRASLGIDPIAPVAACVARLVTIKNHPMLFHAWRRIADVWPGATLLLAGEGPKRAELEALAAKLALGDAVRFLGNRRDVPEILAASDFHVLTSDSEGMSLTLLEAMAAGKPCVATAVGGNPEVIADGVTGLLVPKGDAHAFASAVGALVREPARARKMGEEARKRFRARYTREAMVGAYEEIYRDMTRGVERPALPHVDEAITA